MRTLVPLALLLAIASCSQQAGPEGEEEAFAASRESFSELETTEEKVAALEEMVKKYPNNARIPRMLSDIAYYRGEELGDMAGAYELASTTLDKITEPEVKFSAGIEVAHMAAELDQDFDLNPVVDGLASTRELTFGEHLDVMETALQLEQWDLVQTHADLAMPLSTEEQYRADYPDREYSDKTVAERARNRKALSLTHRGWAAHNLEQEDQAIADLEKAIELTTTNYVGVPQTGAYNYRATLAMAQNDFDKAIKLAAPAAIMGEDKDALETLQKAYEAREGKVEGFEEFLWESRLKLARPVENFTALDYSGTEFEFASLQDKVVLLAFWFPT
jgi:tetratricopeptide (TPR) repeat protein